MIALICIGKKVNFAIFTKIEWGCLSDYQKNSGGIITDDDKGFVYISWQNRNMMKNHPRCAAVLKELPK